MTILSTLVKYGLSAGVAALIYGVFELVRHRRRFRDLPGPPHSFLFGHILLFGQMEKKFPPNSHPQVLLTYIRQKYDLPEVFFLDMWPVYAGFGALSSPDAAAHVVQLRSYGKHPMLEDEMGPMIGEKSIIALNGPAWKTVHSMLAPAFRPSAIRELLRDAVDKILEFNRIMAGEAGKEGPLRLEDYLSRLVFAANAQSVLGESAETQQQGENRLLDQVNDPIKLHIASDLQSNPWTKRVLSRKRKAVMREGNERLEGIVIARYNQLKRDDVKTGTCLLDTILLERIDLDKSGGPTLEQDKPWMEMLLTNLRALLFAAQGTTTDTLCFAYMLLSVFPDVLRKLREEHDRVAGSTIESSADFIRKTPHRLAELEYTTAFLKETLRLFPIGFVGRHDDKDNGIMHYKGKEYRTYDTMFFSNAYDIHHNPEYFPEPTQLKPERWLGEAGAAIPRNAWRPFELGPRACMGREFAMDMMRTVLLMTARWFDFELADDGSGVAVPRTEQRVAFTDLDLKVGDMAFQEMSLEAKPRNGMPMRVKRTDRSL